MEPHMVSECLRFCIAERSLALLPPEISWADLGTIPPTRQQYLYIYLSRSFTGTNRELTIRRSDVHSARGDIPGEDLLPAQEGSFNPIITLNGPREEEYSIIV